MNVNEKELLKQFQLIFGLKFGKYFCELQCTITNSNAPDEEGKCKIGENCLLIN